MRTTDLVQFNHGPLMVSVLPPIQIGFPASFGKDGRDMAWKSLIVTWNLAWTRLGLTISSSTKR